MRDIDVREAVRATLVAQYAGDPSTRIVEEMGVWSGSVRVDLAVINGALAGYEIKSDRDTLDRLPLQAELYSRVFDRMTLVVGRKHVSHAIDLIPQWWGVTVAKGVAGAVELRERRRGRVNPNRDPFLVAQLLWKDEALGVLEKYGQAKGLRGKRIRDIHLKLSQLPLRELCDEVREAMKRRTEWLGQHYADKLNVTVNADCDPAF